MKRTNPILRTLLALTVAAGIPTLAWAADSVTASVVPGITLTSSTALVTGASSRITVRLPDGLAPVEFTSGTGAAQVSKMFVKQISLSTSTPVTLDLTALTGGAGDTAFSKTKIIAVYNNETAGTGKALIVGAAASTPHVFALGGTTPTITVPAGGAFIIYTKETAGWDAATAKSFKLDPGSNAVSTTVVFAGN